MNNKFVCQECGQEIKLNKAKTLGDRVRLLRLKKGLGLREMCREIKISPTTLGRIENGVMDFQFDKIVKISEFLGVSIDFLRKGKQ